jgi:hypothetical protein
MSPTRNSWLNIPAKIRDVVAHHFAPEWHGRPLYLMIPGGVAALTSGVWIFLVAKAALVDHLLSLKVVAPSQIAFEKITTFQAPQQDRGM